MDKLVLGSIFAWSLFVTLRWGLARTFAYAYLPAILFFFYVNPWSLPGIPNMSSPTAVGYAVSLAILVRWRDLAVIRFNVIDALMLVLILPPAISVAINTDNGGTWESISQTGELFFRWVLPYFLARVALQDAVARRHTLYMLCACAVVVGILAGYEARLQPYFVSRQLKRFNLNNIIGNTQVLYRYGLARALVTMGQPIDLGVCGVLVGTMILILTPATGSSWKKPWPLIGICGAGAMVVFSVSFTAWLAMGAAFAMYFVFSLPRLGAYLALPAMVCMICGTIYLTDTLLNEELTERPQGDPTAESKWIRVKIMHDAWPYVEEAGTFGYGRERAKAIVAGTDTETMVIGGGKIGVGSVDNAYLLFILETGWLYLVLWIVLALVLAAKAGVALKRAATVSSMRYPMAAALAGCLATFFAMYTVFYGFVYGVLLCVLFGLISSMTQMYAAHANPALSGPIPPGGMPQPMMPTHLGPGPVGSMR